MRLSAWKYVDICIIKKKYHILVYEVLIFCNKKNGAMCLVWLCKRVGITLNVCVQSARPLHRRSELIPETKRLQGRIILKQKNKNTAKTYIIKVKVTKKSKEKQIMVWQVTFYMVWFYTTTLTNHLKCHYCENINIWIKK